MRFIAMLLTRAAAAANCETVLEILLPFRNVHTLPRLRSYFIEIARDINEAIIGAYPAIVLELKHFPPLLIRHTFPASDNDVVLEIDRHLVFSRTGDQAVRRCP